LRSFVHLNSNVNLMARRIVDPVEGEPLQPGDLVESWATFSPAEGETLKLELPEDGQYYFIREVVKRPRSRKPFLLFEELHNPITQTGELAFSASYFVKVDSANNKITI
jgi:hypothetical protein